MNEQPPLYLEEVTPPKWFILVYVFIAIWLVARLVTRLQLPMPWMLLFVAPIVVAAGWASWTGRLLGTRTIALYPATLVLLRGPKSFFAHAAMMYPGLSSGDAGALAVGIVLRDCRVSRSDRMPGIGHLLPPVRDWPWARRSFHVPTVRTGVVVETTPPHSRRYWISTRDPERVIEAAVRGGATLAPAGKR